MAKSRKESPGWSFPVDLHSEGPCSHCGYPLYDGDIGVLARFDEQVYCSQRCAARGEERSKKGAR